MSKKGRKTSFRDELRRILLTYALVPILIATVLLLGILGYILLQNVIHGSRGDCEAAAQQFDRLCQSLTGKLDAVAAGIDMDRLQKDTAFRTKFNADIYQFVNAGPAMARFYLLDGESRLLFTTETNAQAREQCLEMIYWRLLRNLPKDSGQVVTLLARSVTQESVRADLLAGRALFDASGARIGYACFLLPSQAYEALTLNMASSVLITDRFGSIYLEGISAFDGALGKIDTALQGHNGFSRRAKETYYVASAPVLSGLFFVYAIRECGSILTTLFMLGLVVTGLFLAIIAVMFFSIRHIAGQKTKIIDEITAAFRSAQAGNLNTQLNISSNDEFEVIGSAYNTMLDSIRGLMARSVALAQETAVSKVRQLESQFNPHFLFNTLENVRFMIRLNPKAADEMILHLSGLLRYSIQGDSDTVTLSQDMAYTRSYMKILEARFGKRLQYGIDLPPALENCRIPRLAAQPIIENAVHYGMESRPNILVSVRVFTGNGHLVLQVRDNGGGISAATLAQLRKCMQDPRADNGGHFGILNVHDRLKLMYGAEYGVLIDTREGEGTTVELHIPLENQGEEAGV